MGIAIGYSVVVGWFLKYLFAAVTGTLIQVEDMGAYFGEIAVSFGSIPWHMLGLLLTFIIICLLYTSKQIREALGLRSANFTVENKGGSIAFTTKGFGHGAGMSQYGAKYMAENGSDYQAILNHYYTGIKIEKL